MILKIEIVTKEARNTYLEVSLDGWCDGCIVIIPEATEKKSAFPSNEYPAPNTAFPPALKSN